MARSRRFGIAVLFCFMGLFGLQGGAGAATDSRTLQETVRYLSSLKDRSTGSAGCEKAAEYLRRRLGDMGFDDVRTHRYSVAVLTHGESVLSAEGADVSIHPLMGNAVAPGTIAEPGLSGPLVYAGTGRLAEMNGKPIAGAVILMELDSGKNWLHAANLGARALVYVDRGETRRFFFEDKAELSPIRFPRFWMPEETVRKVFGDFENKPEGKVAEQVRLTSAATWKSVVAENLYWVIPGSDKKLAEEWLMVEAFYDSHAWVSGHSPGADESIGIATLLELARFFQENPPSRSVLMVASSGHAQTLAGMRELIWGIRAKNLVLRNEQKRLQRIRKESRKMLDVLDRGYLPPEHPESDGKRLKAALEDELKTAVDRISRRLIALRMAETPDQDRINASARERLSLRRLVWRGAFDRLSKAEQTIIETLIPEAVRKYKAVLSDVSVQLKNLTAAKQFRSTVKEKELAAAVSLHLSGRGDGVGAFSDGWLYTLKPHINRTSPYTTIAEILDRDHAGASPPEMAAYRDSLRPSPLRTWQSYFPDRPPLGGEVSALAGYTGFTVATVHDARAWWGTPHDLPEKIDWTYVSAQSKRVCAMMRSLTEAPTLDSGSTPRRGFATVTARTRLLRHGELFPDQDAPGVTVLAYQGPGKYHAMTDAMGRFTLKGVAYKKLMLDKVIIEGYRFDRDTGETRWAIDKKQTGKDAYRVKMQRHNMETDLVVFPAKETTVFNLLEPRTFNYMTKLELIDGRREALPLRYWYSRIDTRASTIGSIYLEPGVHLKLTHSDTVLQRKMILLNADAENPQGSGYRIDDWPMITLTDYRVARDMWYLLAPRIRNLETHGVVNQRIQALQEEGTAALVRAESALADRRYDDFSEASARSWALASRVYNHVETTQKDVLLGVLFYIALFVPFAFCMERLLFSYHDIHRRIIAFLAILLALIAVIYRVHPAFQLAYSPTVVILAFFIMGLSLMVTLIIFFRFEQEMVLLQRRAGEMRVQELSRWKAFVAAFFLGVSNLRRRRLRTMLTCATLIILTFTIMSFTTVKTTRHHARLRYATEAPYRGMMFKTMNWQDLPPQASDVLANASGDGAVAAPRVWLENEDRTRQIPIVLKHGGRVQEARAMVGLSALEPAVTGMDRALVAGRWFLPEERFVVLLPERIAAALNIDPSVTPRTAVNIWGIPFTVVGVFSETAWEAHVDLDGEPLTPVTFPTETATEMTEEEQEAMESGEDVMAFQSRYQHVAAAQTVVIPEKTLLAAGGRLKAMAVRPANLKRISEAGRHLVDRFGLTLFTGEPGGTFMYQASDAIQYSGVPNILIPVLISVLIVLNTMIGSVYERKREIGIYTSVGLAPSHVSFLFIAEALAFAVLSVVIGYLLAQTSASLFAGTRFWSGITVNYSSLAGVGAMVLVIVVVLVSVIYPSRVAAEIAIPDVNRSWSFPDIRGNTLGVTLPFLIKISEQRSVAGFLFSYFKGHQDVSHGLFSTGDLVGDWRTDGSASLPACIRFKVRVWLAPFDFGIMQQVTLAFCPADDNAAFLEIMVHLTRETGEANAWKRINKGFLNDLRKQLLIWRSMDTANQRHYENALAKAIPENGTAS